VSAAASVAVASAVGAGNGVSPTGCAGVGGSDVAVAVGARAAVWVGAGAAGSVAVAAGAGAVGGIGVGDFHATFPLDGLLPDASGMTRPAMPARTSVTATTTRVLGRSMFCMQRLPILAWVRSTQQSVRPLPCGLASHR
jgi:hypothetical protein